MPSGMNLDKVSDNKGPIGAGGAWGREETALGSICVMVVSREVIHLFSSPVQHEYEAQDDQSSVNVRDLELWLLASTSLEMEQVHLSHRIEWYIRHSLRRIATSYVVTHTSMLSLTSEVIEINCLAARSRPSVAESSFCPSGSSSFSGVASRPLSSLEFAGAACIRILHTQ